MADNYLEKRYEEVFGSKSRVSAGTARSIPFDSLLRRSSEVRGFRDDYEVHPLQLAAVMSAAGGIGTESGTSLLGICADPAKSELLYRHSDMIPRTGAHVISSCEAGTPDVWFTIGRAFQAMLLKSSEIGLGGMVTTDIPEPEALRTELDLKHTPVAILTIGKPAI